MLIYSVEKSATTPVYRRSRKKKHQYAGSIAVVGLAGIVPAIRSQLTPTPLRSFVVTSVMSSPRAGSPYLYNTSITHAVRSDGSMGGNWDSQLNGREYASRVIHDYEAAENHHRPDQTQSIVVETIPQDDYRHRLAAATSCDGEPAGKTLGVDVNYLEDTYQVAERTLRALLPRWLKSGAHPALGALSFKNKPFGLETAMGSYL